MTKYRICWQLKNGIGEVYRSNNILFNQKDAEALVNEFNAKYPIYHHWFEVVTDNE